MREKRAENSSIQLVWGFQKAGGAKRERFISCLCNSHRTLGERSVESRPEGELGGFIPAEYPPGSQPGQIS